MGETGEAAVLPQELLRRKRLGEVLTAAEIDTAQKAGRVYAKDIQQRLRDGRP